MYVNLYAVFYGKMDADMCAKYFNDERAKEREGFFRLVLVHQDLNLSE